MSKKIILGVAGVVAAIVGVVAARVLVGKALKSGGDDLSNLPEISVWVGNDEGNVEYYQDRLDDYVRKVRATNPDSMPYRAKVQGTDLGSIQGQILQDNTACADVYSVAHDNIGKLAQAGKARRITDTELLQQIVDDNPPGFVEISKSIVQGKEYTFAAPYISQALFLLYDTRKVLPEEVETFEGLAQAGMRNGVKGVLANGSDGFNFCFTILARENERDASGNVPKSSLVLYEGGDRNAAWCQGDDEVAFAKWGRNYYANPFGLDFPSDAGWVNDIQNGKALSLIGGAWHYKAFANAIGSQNVGVAMIPTFTITANEAYGSVPVGKVYRGGTFADAKVLMVNSNCSDAKFPYAQKMIQYLSSKAVQDDAFIKQGNVPSYQGFADKIDALKASHPELSDTAVALAKVQTSMAEYGIPQPFVTALLNNLYYQYNAPTVYKNMIINVGGLYGTDRAVQETLYKVNQVWIYGKSGTAPVELPAVPVKP